VRANDVDVNHPQSDHRRNTVGRKFRTRQIFLQDWHKSQTVLLLGNIMNGWLLTACTLVVLPRCMECQRGLATKEVSLSVRLSNAWIVTKRKKDLSRFLYHTKDHLA